MKNKPQYLLAAAALLLALTACQRFKTESVQINEDKPGVALERPQLGQIAVIDSNLIITQPLNSQQIASPLTVAGRAKNGQGDIYFRLKDLSGEVIASAGAQAAAAPTNWSNFSGQLEFLPNQIYSQNGRLEVYFKDAEGKEKNLIEIPVVFKDYKSIKAKLYFGSSKEDPEMLNCGRVYEAARELPPSRQIVAVIINELFKGPAEPEAKDGFVSYLPTENVAIQKIEFKDNILYVDFNEALPAGIRGACQISFARAQIIETLKQFKDVKDVVISVNDRVWQ